MSADDGPIVREILAIGGNDGFWLNRGDRRYYLAARDNPGGPKLGVVDAETNQLITAVTTAFNAHSVAADRQNNHVFVPLRPPSAGHPEDPNPFFHFARPPFHRPRAVRLACT